MKFHHGFIGLSAVLFIMIAAPADDVMAANCLAYMAADATFEKETAPFRRAKKDADSEFRRAESKAQSKRAEALKQASGRFRNAKPRLHIVDEYRSRIQEAYSIYVKAVPDRKKRLYFLSDGFVRGKTTLQYDHHRVSSADKAAERAFDTAHKKARKLFEDGVEMTFRQELRAAEVARKSALEKHQRSYDKARRVRDDAYAGAYENPGPYRRPVNRYDMGIVLRAARHERTRFCPK